MILRSEILSNNLANTGSRLIGQNEDASFLDLFGLGIYENYCRKLPGKREI